MGGDILCVRRGEIVTRLLPALCAIGCLLFSAIAEADRILHRENSLYSQIVVKQEGDIICLQFDVRRNLRNQSCINKKRPKEMVFSYTKMTMATLLFTPNPKHILIVGLGGGTLPMAFTNLLPEAQIDSIEVDPAVVKVAEAYFQYRTNDRVRTHIQDARVWVKRMALLEPAKYDLVVLDAFNGEYIPEHLMTQEFFSDLKTLMSPEATLAANTFTISDLYASESVTYEAVFGTFINFRLPESANRMIIVPPVGLSSDRLKERATLLSATLKPFRVPIEKYARLITSASKQKPDWNRNARVLTDQYSPANLLQAR
jgi:spermidine synthase